MSRLNGALFALSRLNGALLPPSLWLETFGLKDPLLCLETRGNDAHTKNNGIMDLFEGLHLDGTSKTRFLEKPKRVLCVVVLVLHEFHVFYE